MSRRTNESLLDHAESGHEDVCSGDASEAAIGWALLAPGLLIVAALGVHALAMQGGIWRAACPVWEGVR